ncbi:MAG: TolC family protein [Saprospiraceae bacterium]|nr:TolC family protein [Saprospiraceae bacterium]
MKIRGTIIIMFLSGLICGQEPLDLQQAITVALEQNYGIQVAQLEQEAATMEVYKSNVGMGPVIDLNASLRTTGNNVNQNFTDGRVINRWGRVLNPNINASLSMTLYDGGRMQAAYERLGLLSQFSNLESRIVIQGTVSDVMQTYYDILRNQESVDFLNTTIEYYEERLKITEERWNVGRGSKIDFLQSQTDLNAQLSQLAIAENGLKNAKVRLNGILNRPPGTDFEPVEIDNNPSDYDLKELEELALNENKELLLLQKAFQIGEKTEEELKAAVRPEVFLDAGLGFNYSNTNAGFLLSNRSVFGNIGVSARYNLYDGGNRKKRIEIAKLNNKIIATQQESIENQIINDLTQAYNQYVADKSLVAFEEKNKEIAEENLSISLEKFRLGASSILELNEAQRAYVTALDRLVSVLYNVRISELELLRLCGQLVE